jgi:hypothetical protein
MNAEWHDRHPMPRRPTIAQRVTWHREHQKHCDCRPIPASIRPFLRTRAGKRRRVRG